MGSRARCELTYVVYFRGSTVRPEHCIAPFNHWYVVQKLANVSSQTIIGTTYTYNYLYRVRVISQTAVFNKSASASMTYRNNSFEKAQYSTQLRQWDPTGHEVDVAADVAHILQAGGHFAPLEPGV